MSDYDFILSYIEEKDALVTAVYNGHPEVFCDLLEDGVDPNVADEYGTTALIMAADEGYLFFVEVLIRYGADVNIQDKSGDSALDLAIYKGHVAIANLLESHGAISYGSKTGIANVMSQFCKACEYANKIKLARIEKES